MIMQKEYGTAGYVSTVGMSYTGWPMLQRVPQIV